LLEVKYTVHWKEKKNYMFVRKRILLKKYVVGWEWKKKNTL
jgi:hypothetical protein